MAKYRASCWKQDNWYIAQCQDVDVATQGGSLGEMQENMREALALHFDAPESDIEVQFADEEPVTAINVGPRAERSFLQVRWRLEAEGFRGITQKPNHAKFTKMTGETNVSAILPHYTNLSQAVLYSIWRQAGLPRE
jgi:predicted RNase H-like HicB family nuclease